MNLLFQGSMVALITPFKEGKIDEKSLRNLIDWQIKSGTDALVPCGTTGEAPTLSDSEHERVILITVEQAKNRVPVLAGAGSNDTEKAIRLARQAKKCGARGTLQVTPYYNKPTQEGLFRHFEKIASSVDLPIVLYNVPSRTAVNMEAQTTLSLSEIDLIVGIKEASGKLDQVDQIIRESRDGFGLYSGDDPINVQIYALGGDGTISVAANIVPEKVAGIWNHYCVGDKKEAFLRQEELESLHKALFIETNPIPVKTALSWMGKCSEEFRLPLCPMSKTNQKILKEVLREQKLI